MNDIEIIKQVIYTEQGGKMRYIDIDNVIDNECENFIQAIENLIQRNKDLEQIEKEHKEENGRLREEIDKKDKIINEMKWKPISKYNQKEYDWVLVKYFDGDYECVPDVAEKRSDDRWYNSSGEIIPFEVKYFFDMQILDYFTNKVEEDK